MYWDISGKYGKYKTIRMILKVHIFWEGHKILRNLHQLFDWQYVEQIIGGDFAKFCGLLRNIWTLSEKYEKSPHSSAFAAVGNEKSTRKTDTWQMPDIQFLLK